MPEQNTTKDNKEYWFIMFHPKPERIDEQLKEVNRDREKSCQRRLDYLIPYLNLDKAVTQERLADAELNNSLRSYLRSFVFIKSTASDLEFLTQQDWNTNGLYWLSFRFNHSGDYLKMKDDEMQQLKAIIAEYQYKYGLREYSEDMQTSVKVRMKSPQFKDKIGTVLEFSGEGEGVHLTIGIPVFNDQLIIELTNISKDEVEVIGGAVDDVFSPYFLNEAGNDMIKILRQRVRHQEDAVTRKKNREKLNTYRDVFQVLQFRDTSKAQYLLALRLLNASLLGDAGMKRTLIKAIENEIRDLGHPSSDQEAFLLAILFTATRKGVYRKTVKDYAHEHETTMKPLATLIPILKNIITR